MYNSAKTTVQVASAGTGKTYTGDIVVPATIVNTSEETIPVVGVASSAFSESEYLTSVVLPESVKDIGDYAFDTCEKLTKVEMPGVETIGHWAFRNCYELENIVFPEGLKSIGNYSFDKNYKMTVVDLPSTLTNIGGYVFEGNPQLTTVICRATTPPAVKKGYLDGEEVYTIFDDNNDYDGRRLLVPAGSEADYKSALGWHHFQNNISDIESAGVSSVDADGGEAAAPVYYNLQGMKVANPASGIYIKVQGDKASKVRF